MRTQHDEERLSRMTTCWTQVLQAVGGPDSALTAAQQALLVRYGGAVYRYLRAALKDPDVAEELAQEFAYRVVRGDLRGADPERGRFRDYIRTAVFHLVAGYQRRQRRTPQSQPLPAEAPELAVVEPPSATAEREYQDLWRDELLAKAWEELHAIEKHTGQPWYTMLLLRSEEPDLKSDRMAERLSPRLGRPLTAAGVRQTLHRARVKFAELLVAEVGRSLETSMPDRIEQELIDLGLLPYCREALDFRAKGS
jgi:DNA-directed RNA polymerase specialized sigma24 family protein